MRHSSTRRTRALAGYVLAMSMTSFALTSTASAQVLIDSIASESLNQITPRGVDEGYGPALADDGTTAFWATTPPHRNQSMIYVGDNRGLWSIDTTSRGLTRPRSVKVNRTHVVFIAESPQGRGVYFAERSGAGLVPLHEERLPGKLPPFFEVGMSSEGTIAYSTVCSDCDRAGGALYVGSQWAGGYTELQRGVVGGGAFLYNTQYLDVNDHGQVAVQSEYLPSYKRGVFVLERAGESLAQTPTAVDELQVGSQPRPAINNRGEVAYILDKTQIWISTPTPFGTPKQAQLFLDTSGPYASFERVDIDNHGRVAFQARLDDGRVGVFVGPDPEAHKVIATGDQLDRFKIGAVFIMGGLNQAHQVAVVAGVEPMPDMHVMVLSNLPRSPR